MLWIVSTCVISQILLFLIVRKLVDTFCVIHFMRYKYVRYSYLKINATKLKMSITLTTIYCDIRCVLKKKPSFLFIRNTMFLLYYVSNRIGSVIASSAVDRGFDSRSVQTNGYNIGICSFSAKYAALIGEREQRLAGSSTKWTSSSSHWKLTCSSQDIAENLLSWH